MLHVHSLEEGCLGCCLNMCSLSAVQCQGPALSSSIQLGIDTQQPAHNLICARCPLGCLFPDRRPAPPFAKRLARVVTAAPATSQERRCRPGREGQAHAGGPSPSWPRDQAGCGWKWEGYSWRWHLTPPEHALGCEQREGVAQVEAHGRAKLAVRACSREGGWEGAQRGRVLKRRGALVRYLALAMLPQTTNSLPPARE